MERFCKDLRKHVMKIINHVKKEMIPLADKEIDSYENQKVCHKSGKEFITDKNEKNASKLYHKVRDHCHYTGKFRGAAHNSFNLKYKTSKEIPVVLHNGSTYHYHFIIKQLAKISDAQFECLGENSDKYITFSVPIKKELDNGKTITYKLNFINSYRFMRGKLSYLTDKLSEIYKKECQGYKQGKKIKSECDFIGIKNNKSNYKCKECGKICFKSIIGLIKKFPNMYEFCDRDNKKFVLLLRKGVYPYEHMDSWERFNERSLPDKKAFYSDCIQKTLLMKTMRMLKNCLKK